MTEDIVTIQQYGSVIVWDTDGQKHRFGASELHDVDVIDGAVVLPEGHLCKYCYEP